MAAITHKRVGFTGRTEVTPGDRSHQAFRVLQAGYVALPTLAGLDKFLHVLTNWDAYLAPQVARILPMSGHAFMLLVGVIEMGAGLLVAIRPRLGAYVVAGWLACTVVNLLMQGAHFDVALRDVGLIVGALALGRLSQTHDVRRVARTSWARTPW